jgi:hypothetical protein
MSTYMDTWHSTWVFDWPFFQGYRSQTCYYLWTNDWVISKFLSWLHLIRVLHVVPGFLIWPTFQNHRGQTWKIVACFITNWTMIFKTCICTLERLLFKYQIPAWSNVNYAHQGAWPCVWCPKYNTLHFWILKYIDSWGLIQKLRAVLIWP